MIAKNKYIAALMALLLAVSSCTDLDEKLYDQVATDNYYNTKEDVYRSFLRTFEHGYWTIQSSSYYMQELPADQLMTPNRKGHWQDGGTYARLHYHTWTPQEGYLTEAWRGPFIGIGQANNSIEDITALDPVKFQMPESEKKMLIAELRTMRAWYYIRLLDLFRNIPIVTSFKEAETLPEQKTPQETFDFIEKELLEAVTDLGVRGESGLENANRWTKAGAMSLLVRLYLNAEVYIDESRFNECAKVCQDIIDGAYGTYAIADRWDEPFDSNNDKSQETIFAFPGAFGYSHWHYESGMYWWSLPYNIDKYLGFTEFGRANPRFSLQPGRDVDGNLYNFTSQLGQPFVKFLNYSDDVRLAKYKNLGNGTREGMFLYGYLEYNNGQDKVLTDNGETLYIRDQAGWFGTLGPDEYPDDKTSNMDHCDQHSGVYHVKYPFYSSDDANRIESDYAEVRLVEIYYSLAECKFRAGDITGAETLLNAVRKRNYPENSESLYSGELTEAELLDEWGREFLAEGRRRTDLIRFGKFNTGIWWDKTPDADDHTKIFPIGQEILGVSPQLKQNPGYN